MPRREIPLPWRSFLQEVDQSLTAELHFHCIGGFVITQLYGLARQTADVDVIAVASSSPRPPVLELAVKGAPLHKKYGVYFDFVSIVNVPDDYEQRFAEMFPGTLRRIRLLALDPYDLALSKLERNIQRDRDDVKYLARTIPLDLDLLRRRYEAEMRPYLANVARHDLTLKLWMEAISEERQQKRPET
jgi:hypothetical protein